MQQYRNNRNNGNIYDLRKDLQHTPPPSQQKGSSGSADGRYGFNGEPLSFAPDRTANGTVRRTRTDNSIEFPSQPRRTEQSGTRRTSGQNRNRTAQRSRTAQPEQPAGHGVKVEARCLVLHADQQIRAGGLPVRHRNDGGQCYRA